MISERVEDYRSNVKISLFGENNAFKILGSGPGIVIFLFGSMLVASYLVFLWDAMMSMARDTYQSVTVANNMAPDYNDIGLNGLSFLPYFEVRFLKALDDGVYDIYDDDFLDDAEGPVEHGWDTMIPIDYNKLSKYI